MLFVRFVLFYLFCCTLALTTHRHIFTNIANVASSSKCSVNVRPKFKKGDFVLVDLEIKGIEGLKVAQIEQILGAGKAKIILFLR